MANEKLPAFYSEWSVDYYAQFRDELSYKPKDRELLSELVRCAGDALICDLGCGPGHIGEYLAGEGARVEGVDIAPGMVEFARRRLPGTPFKQGSFFAIPAPDGCYGAVVAFYCLIHAEKSRLTDALGEIRRVLVPGGRLLASFHEGTAPQVKEGVIFEFFTPTELRTATRTAGLRLVSLTSRASYPEEGGDWNRLYLLAKRPAGLSPAV